MVDDAVGLYHKCDISHTCNVMQILFCLTYRSLDPLRLPNQLNCCRPTDYNFEFEVAILSWLDGNLAFIKFYLNIYFF